ncbi:MAG: hypothetical protein R3E56_00620 [Burkholderiaceae bacterium]
MSTPPVASPALTQQVVIPPPHRPHEDLLAILAGTLFVAMGWSCSATPGC